MLKTIEAVIDKQGTVHLKENINLSKARRALVTILDEEIVDEKLNLTTLLSEKALEADWNKPEEDEAWSHLQPDK